MQRIHVRGVSSETVETLRQIRSESGASVGEIVDFCVATAADQAWDHFVHQAAVYDEALLADIQELRVLLVALGESVRHLCETSGVAIPHPLLRTLGQCSDLAEPQGPERLLRP